MTDYISYNDCILRTNGNRKGNILSVEDLAKEYGMNYDAFRKLMTKLRKKQIIDYHDKNTLSTTVGIIQQAMISECAELQYEKMPQTGIIKIYEQGKNRKDRYTACSYGSYFFDQLELDMMGNSSDYEYCTLIN